MAAPPRHRLRKGSKLDDATLAAIVLAFCYSLPVDSCAAKVGASRKRVREIYLAIRDRLTAARFARWHRANALLPRIADPEKLILVKSAFFDVLERCYANESCFKNFAAGNRKTRICQSCPVPAKMTGRRSAMEAVGAIDATRSLYRAIKIHGEGGIDPVRLFRRRFVHMAVVACAAQHTRTVANGLPDFADASELSLRSLFEAIIAELSERPL